jgi:hypothetical protein
MSWQFVNLLFTYNFVVSWNQIFFASGLLAISGRPDFSSFVLFILTGPDCAIHVSSASPLA